MLSTNHWQLKMCFCFLKRTAYAYVTCQDRPSKCQWTSSIVKCASSSFSKRNFPFLTRPHLYRLLVSASNARTPYASPSHHPLWIVQKPTIAATSAKGIHRSSQIKPFTLGTCFSWPMLTGGRIDFRPIHLFFKLYIVLPTQTPFVHSYCANIQ